MFTNEQRAHDIVICMLPSKLEAKIKKEQQVALENSTSIEKVEVVKLYLEMYNAALDKLNELNP